MASLRDLTPQYLHTPRLTLERFNHSAEHYACILGAKNSPTALAISYDLGVRTPAQLDAYRAKQLLRDARFAGGEADDDLLYVLRLGPRSPHGELMGVVAVSQRKLATTTALTTALTTGGRTARDVLPPDLGWELLEPFMKQGYATEAARELLRWLREDFGVREVIAITANERSGRLAQRVGLVPLGRPVEVLDSPGMMLSIYVLPEMKDDFKIEGGLSFK